MDLSGTLNLVTGGGSGIGRSVCLSLADANARVIIADINLDAAEETKRLMTNSVNHLAIYMDVSSSESVEKSASIIEHHYQEAPTGVVHCAGGMPADKGVRRSSLECSEVEWDRIINLNLKGTFLVNTIFARLMKKHRIPAGSIVNIGSAAQQGMPPFVEYSASKAGILGITKTLALELAIDQIRVNAVAPGFIDTPLCATAPPEYVEFCRRTNPLRRIGRPDDVAGVCLFLLSPIVSAYVNGQVIGVDGGTQSLIFQ